MAWKQRWSEDWIIKQLREGQKMRVRTRKALVCIVLSGGQGGKGIWVSQRACAKCPAVVRSSDNNNDNEPEEPRRNKGKQQASSEESDKEQQPPTWHGPEITGVPGHQPIGFRETLAFARP